MKTCRLPKGPERQGGLRARGIAVAPEHEMPGDHDAVASNKYMICLFGVNRPADGFSREAMTTMDPEDERHGYASPPCAAHQLEGLRGGHSTSVVPAALNELLEGERAGARILRETRRQSFETARASELLAALEGIAEDEVRYCSLLLEQIAALGATPSTAIGGFYDKCMAVDDLEGRLRLLNRGQRWVSRKITELMPAVDDPTVRDALAEMRETHDRNVAQLDSLLAGS